MFDAAYPQIKTDYSILHNLFFQDDRWRVYNYTAYQTNQFNQKMLTGDTSNLSLDDFSISLGYGMVYQLNKNNRIGYEYLSSFPFDRGQLIRLFWLRIFKIFLVQTRSDNSCFGFFDFCQLDGSFN
jgi:hypothetical protein